MERISLAPGVHMLRAAADKFNRCRISLHFTFPAQRATATAHALLPLVLERGCASCPDMTELTKKLARLYGADLTVDGRAMGANHNLCISITGLKDAFALSGEALTEEYARLLFDVAFHPYFVGGVFDAEAVSIEKAMLKKGLEDEINDKRIYCQHGAQREFFAGSPAGIRQDGYLSEVDGLTPEALTAAYRSMLAGAQIELILLGLDDAQAAAVEKALKNELSAVARAPQALAPFVRMPAQPARHFTERYDMVQAKLCMMFTMNAQVDVEQMQAYRLAMALFGGSVTSRLFLNVREKLNICYYCSSSFQSFTGSMAVNSGIEPANAEKAEAAILKELADLCGGPITQEELEDCRRGLVSGFDTIEDSLGGIEAWYAMELLRGGVLHTPAEARQALLDVTESDVRAVLNTFSLSVSYLLTAAEEGKNG
ncbi:MAG: insulinase family protein [Faecalibacterium sp.]|nr:insulinase family protein [Faecalibacterium sp.]